MPGMGVSAGSYLRLSVTDRCNLRCVYCRPEGREPRSPRDSILSFEEMLAIIEALSVATPVTKVRITGGEPLVRSGVPGLVSGLRRVLPGAELCLTSNGTALARYAGDLAQAGLSRVNVSIDTLDAETYARLTRGGALVDATAGIRAAVHAGLSPKLNVVLQRSINSGALASLMRFGAELGCQVRFIELMPVGEGRARFAAEYLSATDAIFELQAQLAYAGPVTTRGTAQIHRFVDYGHEVEVGFITSVSEPFCGQCNRLRLDCHGRLFACLRQHHAVDLRTPLREDNRQELSRRVQALIAGKAAPAEGWSNHRMAAIGG